MRVIDCEQGSPEWHEARLGIITASCMSHVMAKGEGKTRATYMSKLIGEVITGSPMDSFSSQYTEAGHVCEPIARAVYAETVDEPVTVAGFIRNHDGIGGVGYSPDALVGDNGAAEIKSKLAHLQVEVLLAEKLPSAHRTQVQCGLWVAERDWMDFVSYCPAMPLFKIRGYRDENFIKEMREEVIRFYDEMNSKLQRITNLLA